MACNVEIRDQAAQPVLSIRTTAAVGDLPQVMGQCFEAVIQYLGELGAAPAGPPFAAYYNMDMEALDVEMGFPVPEVLDGRGEILASEIPAGKVATCVYVGPYEEMGPTYDAINASIAEQGCEPTGVVYEFYLNGPMEVSPQELQTQIVFPLKAS